MINKLELKRQIFHAVFGIVLVILIYIDLLNIFTLLTITIFGFFLSYQSRTKSIPVIKWFLKEFEREENLKNFPGKGILFYFVGASAVLLLFPKDIALAAIMILALGDSLSHVFGMHFGKTRHPLSNTKFIEGGIAGFAAGFIGALPFVQPIEAAVASFTAMIAEAIEVKIGVRQVDDNIIMPFVAGLTIWIARQFLS